MNVKEEKENIEEVAEKEQEIENKKRPPRFLFFRKLSKFLLKLSVGILSFLIGLSIVIIILSQFYGFRHWAANSILGIVNDGLEAKIEIGDLDFFHLDGIELIDVRMLVAGDTLAYIPRLAVDVQFEMLWDSKAHVNRLIMEKPRIKLLRAMDKS